MIETLASQFATKFVSLDLETLEKLEVLSGRVICIEIKNLKHITLEIVGSALKIDFSPIDNADVYFSGTLASYIQFVRSQFNQDNQAIEGITFEGDVELAKKMMDLMQSFEIDWEEQVSLLVGDEAAQLVGKGSMALKEGVSMFVENNQQNLRDYLQVEKRILPHPSEVEKFQREVDELRDGVERLACRIDNLVKK